MTKDLLEDVGWEIIAWLRALSVLLFAILRLLLNVLMEKLSVTWVQKMVAGWETTACLRVPSVLFLVTLLLHLCVLKENLTVTGGQMMAAGLGIIV